MVDLVLSTGMIGLAGGVAERGIMVNTVQLGGSGLEAMESTGATKPVGLAGTTEATEPTGATWTVGLKGCTRELPGL